MPPVPNHIPPKGQEFRIQGKDLDLVLDIARRRQATNVKNGVKEKGMFKLDPEERHRRGLFGEIALYRMMGLDSEDTERNTKSRSAKTDSFDLTYMLRCGKQVTVDVKTTGYRKATHISVPDWKRKNSADIFVQFIITEDERDKKEDPYVVVKNMGAVVASTLWNEGELAEAPSGATLHTYPLIKMREIPA